MIWIRTWATVILGVLALRDGTWAQVPVVRPSEAQVAWQERELEMFVHFGLNTFTGKEWGSGDVSPSVFRPSGLDARQWVAAARSFGARGLVLTTKHHDGFCLWPTATTTYSVRSSPWKDGNGDVVREVAEACREAGLAFGVYLSPADLHEPTYGRDHEAYDRFFRRQLRELLTAYGEISEVWFDGAMPGDRVQRHDFVGHYRLIRELQPRAVIVTKGPDVRWVGNEQGSGRESEWSPLPLPRPPAEFDWPDMVGEDLGSRTRWRGKVHGHWYPAVADVSIRRGWFWNAEDRQGPKPHHDLVRIHDRSVGRNAGLLLNVPPDQSGRIPDHDVRILKQFGEVLQSRYGTNLAVGAQWQVEGSLEGGTNLWTGTLRFAAPVGLNAVVLRENIREGQSIESWELWVPDAGGKPQVKPWATGTTIGYKRLSRGPVVLARELRLRVTGARSEPRLLPPEVHRFSR